MLLLKKDNVDEISNDDLKNQIYNAVPSGHEWKDHLAKEIIQIKNNDLEIENHNADEMYEILDHILT